MLTVQSIKANILTGKDFKTGNKKAVPSFTSNVNISGKIPAARKPIPPLIIQVIIRYAFKSKKCQNGR